MDLEGTRVLIVEDEVLIALEAAQLLMAFSCIVVGIANSVAHAREAIKRLNFDCVMLDLTLRGSLALQIAGELRNRGLPFFICSAHPNILSGFEDVPLVTKPFNKETLSGGLRAALSRRPCP